MRRVLAVMALPALAFGACGSGEGAVSTPTTTSDRVEDNLPFAGSTAATPATTVAVAPPTSAVATAATPATTAASTTRATHSIRATVPPSAPAATAPLVASGAFTSCSAARAAGAAPVRSGEPGYGPHLDSDRDGVGCE